MELAKSNIIPCLSQYKIREKKLFVKCKLVQNQTQRKDKDIHSMMPKLDTNISFAVSVS